MAFLYFGQNVNCFQCVHLGFKYSVLEFEKKVDGEDSMNLKFFCSNISAFEKIEATGIIFTM